MAVLVFAGTVIVPTLPSGAAPDNVAKALLGDTKVAQKHMIDLHGDALPNGAIARLGTERLFHQGGTHVAYFDEGKILASAGNGKVRLWDASTGRFIRDFPGGHGFAVSPDGKYFASNGNMGDGRLRVRIWEIASGKELKSLEGPSIKYPSDEIAMAYSPDGKLLATVSSEGTLRLWDPLSGKHLGLLAEAKGRVLRVVFSPDGRTLILGEETMTRFWEVRTRTERQKIPDKILLAQSLDGKTLALTSDKYRALHLVNAITGEVKLTLKDFPGGSDRLPAILTCVAFAPDGKTFATACRFDTAIRIWDTASGKPLRVIPLGGDPLSVAYAADGNTLAIGVPLGAPDLDRVRLFDPATGEEKFLQPGHQGTVTGVRFVDNGKSVASIGANKSIHLWQASDGKSIRRLALTKVPRAISNDGKFVVVSGRSKSSESLDEGVELWDTSTGKLKYELKGHTYGVINVAFSSDGSTLAVSTMAGWYIYIWDVASGKLRHSWLVPPDSVGQQTAMSFSPDGKLLAIGNRDRVVQLLDVKTGKLVREFGKPLNTEVRTNDARIIISGVSSIAFTSDGKRIAAGLYPREDVYLWDVASGKQLQRFKRPTENGADNELLFSPDNKTLFGGGAGMVQRWETATGKPLPPITVPGPGVRALAVSPDGSRLATGGNDCILVWDLPALGAAK